MAELIAESPDERRRFLHAVVRAADEAPTVQDALRTALSGICEGMRFQAGRLQFSREAGELAHRTFWHLHPGGDLQSFRRLAEERRSGAEPGVAGRVLRRGVPVWQKVPEPGQTGTRAVLAVPVLHAGRVFAALEFFSAAEQGPRAAELETLAVVSDELGKILHRKPAESELRRSEREYRALFERAHDAILIVDPALGIVLDANERSAEVYGYDRAGLIGLALSEVCPHEDLDKLRKSPAIRYESRHRRRSGAELLVDVSAGPVEFRGRRAVWMSNRDITERRRTLEALQLSEERYRKLFDASPQPMWVFDEESLRFLAVNDAAVERYGFSRTRFLKMKTTELGDDAPPFEPGHASIGSAVRRHRRKNGEPLDVEITSHEVEFSGRRARLVVATDVTARLRAEQKLWHAAFYDGLTGLPNRTLFMERLGEAQDRAREAGSARHALLYLDLDRFKMVNDSMGHRAGDQLLVSIARRLERIRRAGDTVARLGGDEFAVLVENVEDVEAAIRVADRVQRELSQPFEIEGQEVFTSASVGIALGRAEETSPEDLLRDADTAMYRAKAQGVARQAVFDMTMHDHAVAVLQLESDLRRAVERRELAVRYQPIISVAEARIVGFEALARWNHQRRGPIPPADFIPLAEETGIISTLGRHVLTEACRRMSALPQGLLLSVNISARQILQPDLVEQISDAISQTGFDPKLLRLEITESVLLENESVALRCLTRLRQLGARLALDDFGTGYSSLSYLHRMPIDELKVDASFVRTMAVDDKNRRIVETIVSLGHKLGVEVVAEGVETREQAQALVRLGCTRLQGFLFAPAVDAAEAEQLLSRLDVSAHL